jgi:peptidyl-prolyl cis-trans isomerase C
MFSFKNIGTPALAALLMVSLPVSSALAVDAAVKTAPKSASAEPAKEQPKDQAKAQAKEQATSPEDTMVKVNGAPILRIELDRAVKVLLAQSQIQPPIPEDTLKQAAAAALEQLTSAELLYQEASKYEVKDLDKLITEKVAQNRAKFSSDAEFEKALKSVDMNANDMRDFTRKDIVINNFIEKRFASKANPTEAEIRKFYDENLDKYFKKPESAKASHILVGVDEKATPEERAKAKKKADEILKRLKAGEDFATIAKSDSTCPSAAQGGDLGNFGRGQMVPAFETAAFALKPGEMSGVVETQFGYHIIKLTEKQEASTEKYEDVKAKIAEFLKRETIQKQIGEYIEDLRKIAKIEKPEAAAK